MEAPDPPRVAGWFAVARSDEVTGRPTAVRAGAVSYVAFRPGPGLSAAVMARRCPHRLVDLSHGSVVDGGLQCPYHGWRFGADGRCVEIPSAGPAAAVPPRAHLAAPWGVRELDGVLWVAPTDPEGVFADPDPDPVDLDPRPHGGEHAAGGRSPRVPMTGSGVTLAELLTNLDPALDAGWHPLLLRTELAPDGSPVTARLLGRNWTARADGAGEVRVQPAPQAVAERFGLIWIAPRTPATELIDSADEDDPAFVGAWLPPERSASAAGVLAENFLDVAHFPFVHAGTFGAAEEHYVPPFDVDVDAAADRLTSVQEQWFDNPEDPGVVAGRRPVRQRRRATYHYRVPFQLSLRLEELDAGAVKTILFFLQPEDAGSTRIYAKMLFHGIGGVARPGPDVVASEVAFERAVLAEDLRLQQAMTVGGLPLRLSDELHVRCDRSGVALRRILARLRARP